MFGKNYKQPWVGDFRPFGLQLLSAHSGAKGRSVYIDARMEQGNAYISALVPWICEFHGKKRSRRHSNFQTLSTFFITHLTSWKWEAPQNWRQEFLRPKQGTKWQESSSKGAQHHTQSTSPWLSTLDCPHQGSFQDASHTLLKHWSEKLPGT